MNTILITSIVIVILVLYFGGYIGKFVDGFIEGFTAHKYTPDEIYTHLGYMTDKLDGIGIKHWIMYGTLLGAVRNNDVIPYDYDFDIGANLEDMNKILELNSTIKGDGYLIVKPNIMAYDYETLSQQKEVWRVSLKVLYNNIPMGDIYLYTRGSDGYMRRFDPAEGILFWPQTIFHSYFIDNLVRVRMRDRYLWAPINSEFLLEYWYGKTWKIPIKSESQGGEKNPDKDYYGGDRYMRLQDMINFLADKRIIAHPKLDEHVEYIFPAEQKYWQEHNDPLRLL